MLFLQKGHRTAGAWDLQELQREAASSEKRGAEKDAGRRFCMYLSALI